MYYVNACVKLGHRLEIEILYLTKINIIKKFRKSTSPS